MAENKITTIWNYSKETEANRILGLLHHIYTRFYQKQSFLISPNLVEGNPKVVYLPDLDYSPIRNFEKDISTIKIDIPIPLDRKITLKMMDILFDELLLSVEEVGDFQNQWNLVSKKFWETVRSVFPIIRDKNICLEIIPTKFGTGSSFNLVDLDKDMVDIKIFVRQDMGVEGIAEGILFALFRLRHNVFDYTWEESEAIVCSYMTDTSFADLFPNYIPIMQQLRSLEDGEMAKHSLDYYEKLGYPVSRIFSHNGEQVYIDEELPEIPFSNREFAVLKTLIENSANICSFDRIGMSLWPETFNEEYSPWAVSKVVQRIRNKFSANGISPSLIQTVRGQGYLLRD